MGRQKSKAPSNRGSLGRTLAQLLSTLVLLALILYAGVFFAARTEGFRSFLEERGRGFLGLPVRIGRAAAGPGLVLTLEKVRTSSEESPESPNVQVDRAFLTLSPRGVLGIGPLWRAVELDGWTVVFKPTDSGDWEPRGLKELESWILSDGHIHLEPDGSLTGLPRRATSWSVSPIAGRAASNWRGVRLVLRNGRIVWRDRSGRTTARAEGVSVWVTPLNTPSRQLTHIHLIIRRMTMGSDERFQSLDLEWIEFDGRALLLDPNMEPAGLSNTSRRRP